MIAIIMSQYLIQWVLQLIALGQKCRSTIYLGFLGGSVFKESAYNVGDLDLIPGFPWRRKCLPTLVFLPGEFHIQKSQVGYSSQGQKESDMTETNTFTFHEHFKALQGCHVETNNCSIKSILYLNLNYSQFRRK